MTSLREITFFSCPIGKLLPSDTFDRSTLQTLFDNQIAFYLSHFTEKERKILVMDLTTNPNAFIEKINKLRELNLAKGSQSFIFLKEEMLEKKVAHESLEDFKRDFAYACERGLIKIVRKMMKDFKLTYLTNTEIKALVELATNNDQLEVVQEILTLNFTIDVQEALAIVMNKIDPERVDRNRLELFNCLKKYFETNVRQRYRYDGYTSSRMCTLGSGWD